MYVIQIYDYEDGNPYPKVYNYWTDAEGGIYLMLDPKEATQYETEFDALEVCDKPGFKEWLRSHKYGYGVKHVS